MARPWFDAASGDLLLDRYVMERPSYQRIVADAQVTDEELAEQAQRVSGLLGELETTLPPDARDALTEALAELAVLNELYQKRIAQDQ